MTDEITVVVEPVVNDITVTVASTGLPGATGPQGDPGVDGTVIEVGTTPPTDTSHLWLDTN